MKDASKSTVALFKDMASEHRLVIHQRITHKIEARQDLKGIYCDPTHITKKALQLSFAKEYHKLGRLDFIRKTVDLADKVIDSMAGAARDAEIFLFLEGFSMSA